MTAQPLGGTVASGLQQGAFNDVPRLGARDGHFADFELRYAARHRHRGMLLGRTNLRGTQPVREHGINRCGIDIGSKGDATQDPCVGEILPLGEVAGENPLGERRSRSRIGRPA